MNDPLVGYFTLFMMVVHAIDPTAIRNDGMDIILSGAEAERYALCNNIMLLIATRCNTHRLISYNNFHFTSTPVLAIPPRQ